MAKKLIYIHGRDTKPSKQEKGRLVRMALLQGLGRVDSNAVDSFVNGKIELLVAYYGDISNIIMKYHVKAKCGGKPKACSVLACHLNGIMDTF